MKNLVTLYHTGKTDRKDIQESDPMTSNTEPIRGSLVLFIIKIASILIVTDLIYAVVNFILLRAFFLNHELPLNLHDLTVYVLTILHLIKTAFQVWGISAIVMRWVGNSFTITEEHLIHHEGILNCLVKIYDLDIIRSVSIQQSWFGKIFRYGTVNVEISASGGYTDQIILYGVSSPWKYEKMLRHHL